MPFALVFVLLIGFVALGSELVFLLAVRRNMQMAADSAAYGAATAILRGYPANYANEAYALAAAAGFVQGQGGALISVHRPPTSGSYTTDTRAVEIVISQPWLPLLSAFFHPAPFVVAVRAVALADGETGCVLALASGAAQAFQITGTASATLQGCALDVNSSSPQALSVAGTAALTAQQMSVVGDYTRSGTATINVADEITTNAAAVADPYAGVVWPAIGPCNYTNFTPTGKTPPAASPGVYCGGMTIAAGTSLTLNPGLYIIDQGVLQVNGGASLTGTGVTIFLTSSAGSNYASAVIAANSIVTLAAPTSGTTAGLVFFSNAPSTSGAMSTFNGGAAMTITGAIYLPGQAVTYSGGSNSASGCTQLIANTITMTGNSTLALNCSGTGIKPIIGGVSRLTE